MTHSYAGGSDHDDDDETPKKPSSESRELRNLESSLLDTSKRKRAKDDDKEKEAEERPSKSRELRQLESDFLDSAKKLPVLRKKGGRSKRRSKRVVERKVQEGGLRVRGGEEFDPTVPAPPKESSKGMFNGTSRPAYLDGTKDKVLARMRSKTQLGTRVYECPGCKNTDAHWVTADEVTIDHKMDWQRWIRSKAKPEENGEITNESARIAYSDIRNLKGMCQPCNSSKSGPKGVYG